MLSFVKELLKNTSIHGLKYLVEEKLNWSERIFWIVCLLFSWYGSTLLIIASWDAYKNNPISFVVETTYNDWKTHFPAVVVCETENSEKIEQASDILWSKNHDFNLEEVLKEIAFYKGVSYYLLQFCGNSDSDLNCPKGNFTYYAGLVRSSCEEMFSNCSWGENSFDCCEHFIPMETEVGPCYAINSIQGKKITKKKLKMVNDRLSGPGTLEMNVHVPSNIYVLGDEEVPALTSLTSDILAVAGQIHYKRHISLRSIENDLAARDVVPAQRRCKYPDEESPSVYRYHSYSACTVRCRREAQLRLCNCTNFFMPNTSQSLHCGLTGLLCLHENYGQLSVLKAGWGTRAGLFCDCQPSCTETDISIIADDRTAMQYSHSHVEISLDFLPTERFRRNVIRGFLDLVVSMGGTAGLFLGASILSLIELPYFLLSKGLETMFNKPETIERPQTTPKRIKSVKPLQLKAKRITFGSEKMKHKQLSARNFYRSVIISEIKSSKEKQPGEYDFIN